LAIFFALLVVLGVAALWSVRHVPVPRITDPAHTSGVTLCRVSNATCSAGPVVHGTRVQFAYHVNGRSYTGSQSMGPLTRLFFIGERNHRVAVTYSRAHPAVAYVPAWRDTSLMAWGTGIAAVLLLLTLISTRRNPTR
jgi:hypothetical protein